MTKPLQKSPAEQIEASYRSTRKQLEASMKLCKPGSTPFATHIKLMADLDRKYRQERRDCGLDPSNLGPEESRSRVWIANSLIGPVEAKSAEEMLRLLTEQAHKTVKSFVKAGYFSAEREQMVAEFEAEYGDDADVCGPKYEGEKE